MADVPKYRFGPLEKRGILAGLGASQLAVVSLGAVCALVALRALPSGAGLGAGIAILSASAAVAIVHVKGTPLIEWTSVVAAWSWQRLRGTRRFASRTDTKGTYAPDPQPDFPSPLEGAQILSHALPGSGEAIGVLKHPARSTYTAVVKLRGRSFSLLDPQDKARTLAAWGSILSSFAREAGVVHRLQWIERTAPDPSDEVALHLRDKAALPLDSPIVRSYLEVLDDAGPVSQTHEVLLALQLDARRIARAVKAAGGGDHGACEILRRELKSLTESLVNADVTVEGVLTPRLLAAALRTGYDPASRAHLARLEARSPDRAGSAPVAAGPMTTETTWRSYHADGAYHATYWISEWPRVDVEPDFLAALLLRTECTRTVAVTMEPVPPLRAIRAVEAARTSMAADEDLRGRAGFLSTVRRRREDDALAQHERELANGHALFKYAGHITVTGTSLERLEAACGEIEEAAGRCLLDVRRLDGRHHLVFACTLPTCLGLK
ncbi:MAG: type VII secretion protein EccE, partial [Actinomycetota bacterium]|nr:type VII secretion protein EccE [Actinomycetota bacterium]